MTWNNKRVLVTGAGGFIGSHLTERLVELGATVRAMVHYNALGSAGWLDTSPHREAIDLQLGDITDAESVNRAVKGVDVVFHLGALIAIPYSYHAPLAYIRTNIEGTYNVLQAVRQHEVSRMVHTSTSETYGTAQYAPIDEKHPLQGQSPYSASKIGADKMAEAFFLSFGTPVVTMRPFNTFGPRQSARAFIPTVITQCLSGNVVRVGNLHPTRDLNFVQNTVDGFVALAEHPNVLGQTVNIGYGTEISMGDLAQKIITLAGSNATIETDPQRLRPTGSEVDRLLADTTKARDLFGYQPRVSLDEGLARTIAWARQNLERYRPNVYNI